MGPNYKIIYLFTKRIGKSKLNANSGAKLKPLAF